MNKQIAKLLLTTSNIQTAATNQYGTADMYLTDITWNNLNLRTMLGDMWDKYNLFNLSLVEISSAVPVVPNVIIGNYQNIVLNITGLPFINQSYDTSQRVNTNVCVLGTYQFSATTIATKLYQNSNVLTFSKIQEQCDLSIYYTLINGGSPASATALYPEMVFIFNITGVEIDKDTNMEQRMKIK